MHFKLKPYIAEFPFDYTGMRSITEKNPTYDVYCDDVIMYKRLPELDVIKLLEVKLRDYDIVEVMDLIEGYLPSKFTGVEYRFIVMQTFDSKYKELE